MGKAVMKNYHLTPQEGRWKLTMEARENPLGEWDTKEEAVEKSTRVVEGNTGSLKIHLADGTIEEERTYPRAADPVETKG